MGHFSQTCLLSHLPITGGTPIRVCLLCSSPYSHSDRHGEAWSFRSIPFRAEYNDYGSIQNVHPDDQVLVDLAISQLNRDAVEIPQGDNPYHDPPVTRGMPAEGWWEALWEGRLQVWDNYGAKLKVKVPKGVPTWRRVKKFLDRAVAKGDLISGSVVNRIAYGMVRVTYHGQWEMRYEWYTAIRPILERKYKVTERYEHGLKYHEEMVAAADKLGEDPKVRASLDVWFEVAPKDGEYLPVNPARKMHDERLMTALENSMGAPHRPRKKCDIAWAFIREDAWQAVLPMGGPNYTGWRNTPTVESSVEKFRGSMARAKAARESRDRILAMRGDDFAKALKEVQEKVPGFNLFDTPETIMQETFFSLDHLVPGGGISSEISEMLQWMGSGRITPEQGEAVTRAFAEFNVIRSIASIVCIAPRPTHGGPQDGAWEAHVAFHNAMTPVVLNADPYPPEEGEESDYTPVTEDGDLGHPEVTSVDLNLASEVSDEETTYADVDIETD